MTTDYLLRVESKSKTCNCFTFRFSPRKLYIKFYSSSIPRYSTPQYFAKFTKASSSGEAAYPSQKIFQYSSHHYQSYIINEFHLPIFQLLLCYHRMSQRKNFQSFPIYHQIALNQYISLRKLLDMRILWMG